MSISKINSITETKANTNTPNKAVSTEKQEHKIDNNTGKILLISALTVLAAGGIYLASKGRGKVKNLADAENKATETSAGNKLNIDTEIKDMGLDVFKKQGNKFVKGKAILSSGENYSGKLAHKRKDGKNITLEYKDGILQKVSGAEYIKEYQYDNDGKISNILKDKTCIYNETLKQKGSLNIRCIETSKSKIYIDDKTGKIRKIIENDDSVCKLFDENGILKYVEIINKDGGSKFITYHPDGKTKRLEIISYGNYDTFCDVFFYDKQGNLKEKIKVQHVLNESGGEYSYDGLEMKSAYTSCVFGDVYKYMLSDPATGKLKAILYKNSSGETELKYLFVDDKQFDKVDFVDDGIWETKYVEETNRKNAIKPTNDLYNKFVELDNQYISEFEKKFKKAGILLKIIERDLRMRLPIKCSYNLP